MISNYIYDAESKTWTGLVPGYPGCITQGDTLEETRTRLEAVAESWIEAALEMGQEIPE